MTKTASCALFVGALLVLSGHPADLTAQVSSFGPLTYEEGGPLQQVTYTPATEGVETTPPGSWRADLWLGYSNLFEQDSARTHELFIDMERLSTTLTMRRGLTDRLEVGGRLAWASTGGGILDSFIVWWHNKLSLGNANRERYPFGEYGHRFEGPADLLLIDVESRTFGLDNLRLFAKWHALASADGRSGLSARVEWHRPVQRNRAGRDRAEVGAQLIGRVARGPWYFHGSLGASTLRPELELENIVRSGAMFVMVGAERAVTESFSAIVQYQLGTPVLKGFREREVDQPPRNLVFGAAGRFGTDWRWEASFQEDLPADTPAIDFTLGLRLSRIW